MIRAVSLRSNKIATMSRISSVQSKMARAALGWGVRELASAAKMSTDTVCRFERGDVLKERTVDSLASTLETAGVEFLPGNGVRLKVVENPAPGGGEPGESDKPAGSVAPAQKKTGRLWSEAQASGSTTEQTGSDQSAARAGRPVGPRRRRESGNA
jgi:transcriptional regulator with XRE-family HTH domain